MRKALSILAGVGVAVWLAGCSGGGSLPQPTAACVYTGPTVAGPAGSTIPAGGLPWVVPNTGSCPANYIPRQ